MLGKKTFWRLKGGMSVVSFFCFFFSFFLFFFLFNNNIILYVDCFNNEGHEAIGMVAMSGLKNDQLYELKKLLNGKDIVDIGKWGHIVHDKITGAKNMHFNLQQNDCKNINFECKNANGLCLINSIKYFYNKLLSTTPDTKKNIINNNLDKNEKLKKFTFIYPRNIKFTDSDSLKYLISLISDLHQPLRIGFTHDNGGQNINITHFNVDGTKVKTNLFEYMENEIISKMINKYQSSWYSGWTHINRIFDEHKKDEELFEKYGIDVIDIWAKQIISEFCSEFYLNNYVTQFMMSKGDQLHFDTSNNIDIFYDLEFILERLIRFNMLRAGSRISIILNYIFSKKKFSNFRKKSVFDKDFQESQRYHIASAYKNNAIFINLTIIFVILLLLFYFNFIMKRRNKMHLPDKIEHIELQAKCN
ncbi:P1 nuclease, putative [Plasmodium sp. gorilla clade G2]|uniref:P1 nuclease, putative n=1 Tax=Plasmodium sp. gorilla clade G2 TaxID=880535 RepID=UPI000D2224FE|nr:P1 nuclease, putative [Plasmodium sp. gorilla clade G2]SOV14029.1 P1 nuclease, putative [Plasmodium sp. gorilla clade G2]